MGAVGRGCGVVFLSLVVACGGASPGIGGAPGDAPAGGAYADPAPAPSGASTVLAVAAGGDPDGIYPAGLCGFEPYLSGSCDREEPPAFAVVLDDFASAFLGPRRGEPAPESLGRDGAPPPIGIHEAPDSWFGDRALRLDDELDRASRAFDDARALGLPAGYPFFASWDDMPDASMHRRGLALVAGLFATKNAAERFVRDRALGANGRRAAVVALGPGLPPCGDDYEACEGSRYAAVQIASKARAYRESDLARIEEKLDQLPWPGFGKRDAERSIELGKLTPVCTVDEGRVFLATHTDEYRMMRTYAPVSCARGERAWVPWRATRLESVVTTSAAAPSIHQVVMVMCDSATIEDRPFGRDLVASDVDGGGCPG